MTAAENSVRLASVVVIVLISACIPEELTVGSGPGESDPTWACLGQLVEPVPNPMNEVELSVRLSFASDNAPLTEATIDVCDKLDVACTGMDPDFPKGVSLAPDGAFSVMVVEGFDGFLRIASPEVVDSRVYVGQPLVKPLALQEVPMLRAAEYETLANLVTSELDVARGTAFIFAFDCEDEGAAAVRFEAANADDESSEFYLIDQSPVIPPNATGTDDDGIGGFLNLPVGVTVARSFRASDDVLIGESSFPGVAEHHLLCPDCSDGPVAVAIARVSRQVLEVNAPPLAPACVTLVLSRQTVQNRETVWLILAEIPDAKNRSSVCLLRKPVDHVGTRGLHINGTS